MMDAQVKPAHDDRANQIDREPANIEKIQVYLREDELDALRRAAGRSDRSVSELARDAICRVVLKPKAAGPIAIWKGEIKRTSVEHDAIYDEPNRCHVIAATSKYFLIGEVKIS